MPDQQNYEQFLAGYGIAPKAVTAGMLSDGVLTVPIDVSPVSGGVLDLANGVTLRGLMLTENGNNINLGADVICTRIAVRCPSGSATLKHEEGPIGLETTRLWNSTAAADIVITPGHVVELLYDQNTSRWSMHAATLALAEHVAAANPHPQYSSGNTVIYAGTTSGSGTFTVVYPVEYADVPHVAPQLLGGTNSPHQFIRLTSSTTTGFTVTGYQRASVNLLAVDVLLAATTTVNGLSVSVAVVSND